MENQPKSNPTSVTEKSASSSTTSSPKQIVQVHSPVTPEMFPPKFDLNQHRPVLHKYTPEQVEIVYHRRTGTDEVVSKSSHKRKKKNVANGSITSPSAAQNNGGYQGDESFVSNSSVIESLITEEESLVDPVLSQVDATIPTATVADSKEQQWELPHNVPEPLHDNNESKCSCAKNLEEFDSKTNEFVTVVTKMADLVVNLENRVKHMELLTQNMATEQMVLRKLFVRHLRANKTVAEDMKNLHTVINNPSSVTLDEKVKKLLEIAKDSTGNNKQQPNGKILHKKDDLEVLTAS